MQARRTAVALGLKKQIVKLEVFDIRHHQVSNTRHSRHPHNSSSAARRFDASALEFQAQTEEHSEEHALGEPSRA